MVTTWMSVRSTKVRERDSETMTRLRREKRRKKKGLDEEVNN